ncbi:MAG: hypothetical protein ACKO37_04930 [Vampirovibrionales bacterium]
MRTFNTYEKKFLSVLGFSVLVASLQQVVHPTESHAADVLIPTECVAAMTHYSEPLMGGTSSVSPCSAYLNRGCLQIGASS